MCGRAAGLLALLLAAAGPAWAAAPQSPPKASPEDDFYALVPIPIPEGIVLEAGGLEWRPEERTLYVSTRRGEIWKVENALETPPARAKFTLFASGLHEVLGLAWRDGWFYAMQRGEITRLRDTDGDGRADRFETFCDDWAISGDYHEYAFCSKFDREGNLWVVLCLTGSFTSDVPFRGWCVRITPEGKMIPTTSGIRSPGGIGMNAEGDMFYCDNQGPWNGTSSLKWLKPGAFVGHPDGNKWYSLAPGMGPRPPDPKSGSRFHLEAARIPQYEPPAVLLPHGKVGNSASGIVCDETSGKFGPFVGQLFVSDQSHSVVNRVFLERVRGRYQGACFPFRAGFGSGNVPMLLTADGVLFVGGTNRGWGSRGPKPFALDRVTWTGKIPFEVLEMRIRSDGFELVFTEPVDPASAGAPASYALKTYTYIFQSAYGSPEVDATTPRLREVRVLEDRRRVRLVVEGLQIGHVHELALPGVRSAEGKPLLHPVAYYTLWNLP
jgi:glucose/arabinose dehydrogenase